MPPGPFPFPWIGNLPDFYFDSSKRFKKLREKYGDIFTVTLFENTVFLNTASLAREARLGHKDDVVALNPESIYPIDIVLGGNDVVFSDYGTAYLFRKRVFKSAMHVFGAGIEQVEERGGHAVNCTLGKIESLKGQPFSPKEIVASAIHTQLWEWITSEKVSLDDPVVKLLLEFGEIVVKQTLEGSFYQFIPFHSYLPIQFNRDIMRAKEIKSMLFPQVFQSHLETYNPGVTRDLTDSFIIAYKKEIAKETGKDIGSIQDVPALMLDVAVAGSDTTSSTIAWFIMYMVLYPEIQEKIHDELDQVVGGVGQLPRWQDVKDLAYLQATICEVLRRASPVPLSGSNTLRDITLAGYHIPKGTMIIFDITQVHLDEKEWPQAEEFKPERFLDDEGKFVGWTKFNAFMPFGLGRRECGGTAFAKIMLFTFTATLFHRLKFELPEGATKPSTESSSGLPVVSSPSNDFKVIARNRVV